MGKLHGGCSVFLINIGMMICTTALIILAVGSSAGSLNRRLLLTDPQEYAVVFDAGSTGSRVHVFRFDSTNLDLLPIGQEFEFNNRTTPGLSAYENNPNAAADSLRQLLQQAVDLIPTDIQPQTPVRLGATAGLRLLSGDTAERILEAVRELLRTESELDYRPEWVSIIDGFQEGSYMWVAVNFLLENLGKPYSETVGVVDLGGASVQMAYSISQQNAANAAVSLGQENDNYLVQWNLRGIKYHLYAHSYLRYGLQAARAQILKLSGDRGNPCVLNGYQGTYNYSGEVYNVTTPPSGTNMGRCRTLTRKILNVDASCLHQNCTFNGVWNGGGGDGQKNLYVATSFYYTATAANVVDPSLTSAKIRPMAYREAAKIACGTDVNNIRSKFPNLRQDNLPFLCMDLLYEYSLLVNGFGIKPKRELNVVQRMEYKGSEFEAAWPLGCAIDILSPPQLKLALYRGSF